MAVSPALEPFARSRLQWSVLGMRGLAIAVAGFLIIGLALPLAMVIAQSAQDTDGKFVGVANYVAYFAATGSLTSIGNTLIVGVLSTLITIPLAFAYAYAIHRSCIPAKALFRNIALIPLLTPSLLFALSLVLLFGNQGILKELLLGQSIYGLIGIVVGMTFAHFPHTFIVISAALSLADRRHFEAAESLGASRLRIFLTVTLPGVKYGLISASIVSFMLSITDFGIPKVIGGQYNVLATDIYKQVIGQQNFELGAVVSVLLLAGAVLAFGFARLVQHKQITMMSGRAVPYEPAPRKAFDLIMLLFCSAVALAIIGVLVVAVVSSFIRFWPYNMSLTLRHYNFDLAAGGGWHAYTNSLTLATWTALVGTIIVFIGAYLVEKSRDFVRVRQLIQVLAAVPMAVPGLVLGLAYIFFFNKPGNPLGGIYGGMTILVLVTIIHFYSVTHFTMVTALKQVDPEFESISDSLKASRFRTLARVTVPLCMPAMLDVSIYFFLSAMTTVSAVVFLYSTNTSLASVAVINMDDAGEFAFAIAMACVISATCIAARGVHFLLTRGIRRRAHAWRAPTK
ncbi:MAG TPA: putative 2-aminoethylphosphonate ABC transporter permease subunit [Burkholderiaceae bacterium]|nr:putative 2-aminoethylphosphonate ABC transporter permease subunit [Burkholderiaceae bacterium]